MEIDYGGVPQIVNAAVQSCRVGDLSPTDPGVGSRNPERDEREFGDHGSVGLDVQAFWIDL
jgi:hypothetical protein